MTETGNTEEDIKTSRPSQPRTGMTASASPSSSAANSATKSSQADSAVQTARCCGAECHLMCACSNSSASASAVAAAAAAAAAVRHNIAAAIVPSSSLSPNESTLNLNLNSLLMATSAVSPSVQEMECESISSSSSSSSLSSSSSSCDDLLPLLPGRSRSLPNLYSHPSPVRALKRSSDSTLGFAKRRRRAGAPVYRGLAWNQTQSLVEIQSQIDSENTEMDICPSTNSTAKDSSSSSSSSSAKYSTPASSMFPAFSNLNHSHISSNTHLHSIPSSSSASSSGSSSESSRDTASSEPTLSASARNASRDSASMMDVDSTQQDPCAPNSTATTATASATATNNNESTTSTSSSNIRSQRLSSEAPASMGLGSGWKQNYSLNMVSPPPVNLSSLKEIDLQEIFKNPQLRHDIVFDPQLQFRPNLDGERGKRKKIAADKYWSDLALECDHLSSGTIDHSAKILVLFQTLRDIIVSLLPAKTRSYVESVLDPDLIHQQLRHRALDFVGLAKWLASVFKAHCAPMRDGWVDQMVDQISQGVASSSTTEVVDGLRMVFSILEAMKLDVANHQIRTLRPILVESAIEFEQEYYHQVISRGKLDLKDSVDWFKSLESSSSSSSSSLSASSSASSSDNSRDVFIAGMVNLLLCNGVCEFPSTFGFDVYRMASFRADLRRVVCLQLCMVLYQQLLKSEAPNFQCSGDHLAAFKNDILAIVSDSNGNAKWTKNVHSLALEISRRVQQLANGQPASASASSADVSALPRSDLVNMASAWIGKHLQPKSPVYTLMEKRMAQQLQSLISTGVRLNTHSLEGVSDSSDTSSLASEMQSLSERVQVLVKFHWGVFSKYYMSGHDSDDASSSLNSHAHFFKVVASRTAPGLGPMASSSEAGRVRQPSTC